MYTKSFVSISISNYKVKVVKLTGDGKQLYKAVSYDIPEGVVSQGRVQMPPEFAGIIKTIWKKEKIHEKTVGLIVPEFSTFMKTLSLPKLAFVELDEAVRWRSKEFLPHEGNDMVLDWKIISEQKDTYEVLLVAIEVEDLSGFVGAIDAAGLLPILVETPSLSLERLAENVDEERLVLYRSKGTVVAVVISGKKILATSVLSEDDESSLVTSVVQIVARYGKTGIKSVAVCGNGLTQDFVNVLHLKTNLPVQLLSIPIKGLTEAAIQDFIIGLSQQQINPEEPASAYSINLLPTSWVTHYKTQARDFQLWTTTLVGSVVLWLCFLITLALYVFLSQKIVQPPQNKNQNPASLQAVTTQISSINATLTKINTLSKSFIYPQDIINIIQKNIPIGVAVTGYEINVDTGKVDIVGSASTRESLLNFKQKLETIPDFSKVSLPLASLLTEQNITFSVDLDYKAKLIKK